MEEKQLAANLLLDFKYDNYVKRFQMSDAVNEHTLRELEKLNVPEYFSIIKLAKDDHRTLFDRYSIVVTMNLPFQDQEELHPAALKINLELDFDETTIGYEKRLQAQFAYGLKWLWGKIYVCMSEGTVDLPIGRKIIDVGRLNEFLITKAPVV